MVDEPPPTRRLRGPPGKQIPTDAAGKPFRRMQELRRISRDYPFICPVDFLPHRGSPPGEDPNLDPTFVARHTRDDGDHYLA
ncbi:MAG: hypothetical protein ACREKH_09605 [Candidatus Rokuibacteriota bacterium]